MARLNEIQDQLHKLFRGESSAEETASALGIERPERLDLYRGFVRHHMRSILTKVYPHTQSLLSKETWSALDDRFFAACPSYHWELNENAKPFVDFLQGCFEEGPYADLTAFHVELAHFEWEEFGTYMDSERMPHATELEQPTLNPTLNILQTHYPIFAFVRDLRKSEDDPPPLPELLEEPQTLFLFQHPETFKLRYHTATPELLFAIKMCHDGLSVAQASAASGHDEAVVANVLDIASKAGIVILPAPATD